MVRLLSHPITKLPELSKIPYIARNIVVLAKLSSFKIYELSVIAILDVILIKFKQKSC
jgi:hypothetical protein